MRGLGGLRVGEHAKCGFLRAVTHECLEHSGRVARAAAPRIVLRIGDNDGSLCSATDSNGLEHRFVRREQRLRETFLHAHDVVGKTIRGRIHRRLRVAVRDNAGAAVMEIRRWKARAVAKVEDVAAFARGGFRDDSTGRLDHRALEIERDQERDLAKGPCSRAAAFEHGGQDTRRPAAGLQAVDMRVRVVHGHAVGKLSHRRREVGVIVEADHDRDPRPDHGAHAAQEFAFAVLEIH